ncbi:hypothetical protein HZH66_002970 [Vespula vulgaris]|uniref:Uncharacterized protein n=1 Tax=Vespula vulgaris TaxID=7454 RepID=A0A834KKL9_VESVU|nr:hypothetical protein HZH66_002970 [Vespula vulgaris]
MQENKLRLREPSEILRREGVSGATVNAATATATAVRKEETTMRVPGRSYSVPTIDRVMNKGLVFFSSITLVRIY